MPGAVWANWRSKGVLVLFNSIKVKEVVMLNIFSNKKIYGKASIVNKAFNANMPTTDQSIAADDRKVKAR